MSTAYNTSAKPRGRREGDNHSERHSSSRASSQTSNRLSKTASRPLDDPTVPRSRPDSPALFWQRNKAMDSSRPTDSILVSPKASFVSTKQQPPPPPPENDVTPTPTSPTRSTKSLSSKKSAESTRGSKESIGFGMDNMKSSISRNSGPAARDDSNRSDVSQQSSRPKSKSSIGTLSQAAVAQMQPKVSDASEEDTKSQSSVLETSSRASPEAASHKHPDVGERRAVASGQINHNSMEGLQYPYQPPQTTTPAISPPQSPLMYQQNPYGSPPPGAYAYQYPPYMDPSGQLPGGFYPAQYPPPPPQPQSQVPYQPQEYDRSSPVPTQDEHQRILEKVTGVLPDINRLLEHYQLTQGELSAKDLLVRQTELQRTEEISRLRFELDAKKEEFEKLIERLVGENYKIKAEAQEKDIIISALRGAAAEHDDLKQEFEQYKAKHAEAISTADAARLAKEQLLSDKIKLDKDIDDQRKKHRADLDNLKNEHKVALEAKDKDHHKAASEHKVVLSKVQMELASLITRHSQQKKDFETSRGLVAGLETKLATSLREHEDALTSHRQQLESQLESLTSQRQQEIQSLQENHDQKLKDLGMEHESKAAKIMEEHQGLLTEVKADLESQKEAFGKLHAEHEDMGAKHTELVGAVSSWKTRREEWEAENDKLHKLMETLGHGSSKSAQSYTEAFEQLSHMIEAISRDFFLNPVVYSPAQQRMLLEPGVPDVFGSTQAASQLRSLLIQHKIFKVLNKRIFERFLFVPFDEHPDAPLDHILGGLSSLIGQKSIRREALWRCIVLRAIYTSSEGKATANIIASTTFREIMEQIQDLADPDERERLAEAVKPVVKRAVELWRQARVEVDCIHSSMPEMAPSYTTTDVILWIRPHIIREQIGSLIDWGRDNERLGGSHVLLEGVALRQDTPLVSEREAELAQRTEL